MIKCSESCVIKKRNDALAEALGIEARERKVREVDYDPMTLSYYSDHPVRRRSFSSTLCDVADRNETIDMVYGARNDFHRIPQQRQERSKSPRCETSREEIRQSASWTSRIAADVLGRSHRLTNWPKPSNCVLRVLTRSHIDRASLSRSGSSAAPANPSNRRIATES